jgi:hypothetical protein
MCFTPVSTVASESAFSTSGRILDSFRSCLNPEMVEALIWAQNWLMSSLNQLKDQNIQEDLEASEKIVRGSNFIFKLTSESFMICYMYGNP